MIAPLLTSLIAVVAAAQSRDPVRVSSTATVPARAARASAGTDSVRTVRAARRAQEQFEALRRANLPFRAGAPRGPCDLQVGRLCYWHDDGYPSPEAPEPERISRARERFLRSLADADRSSKGDEWIIGQRIRYLLEARRNREAIDAARDCVSTAWWCSALAGFAFHLAGEYETADSAYHAALAAMPVAERCNWTDISMFVEGEAGKRYRRLSCDERADFERRFWWLSKPLYAVSGNEMRTEFLARRTMSRLEQQARSAYNMSWGSDVEELLMRFGWPTWWTRDHPSSAASPAPPSIVGHEPTPSFFFHPTARLLDAQPWDARADDWDPRAKLPPARYAPAYAASFSDLQTQTAVFRRGDSALVVVTYEQPKDSLFNEGIAEAVLAIAADERTPMAVVRRNPPSDRLEPLALRTAWRPMLVSVELRSAKRRGFARARFGVLPDDERGKGTSRLQLSDLLLYSNADSNATSLDDLARYALGSGRITGGRVGVYWEMYGVRPAGEPLGVMLTVERVGANWRTRAAERLGLARKATPLRVRWQEVPKRDSGIATRAIVIDVGGLPSGRYRMQLMVTSDDGTTATSERVIELLPER